MSALIPTLFRINFWLAFPDIRLELDANSLNRGRPLRTYTRRYQHRVLVDECVVMHVWVISVVTRAAPVQRIGGWQIRESGNMREIWNDMSLTVPPDLRSSDW